MTPLAIAPVNLEPRTWTWQGYQITYTVAGEGKPLVLVHGFGASWGHWRNNIPVLAKAGYRVFALDLLGFGASAKPPLTYSLELWQGLLQDFCSAQVKAPAVFIGNSIGALLSLMMLADYPNLAEAGVLINCAGGLTHRSQELNLSSRLMMGILTKLVGTWPLGTLIFNVVRRKANIRRTLYQVYGNPEAVTEELVTMLHRPSCDPGAQQAFASIVSAPPGPSLAELLPRVAQPLLVLWGEADPWTPVTGGRIFRDWEQATPAIDFIALPEMGHCPHDERPEVVNPLILKWLADR